MQFQKLSEAQRRELLAALEGMPGYLRESFATLTAEQARRRGPGDFFSPVEHVWHLVDLEREGFNRRISRLLMENDPLLPDFDGDAIAAKRNYRALSLSEGLAAFTRARRADVAALRAVPVDAWTRAGRQEGTGPVTLGDMPALMRAHDDEHRSQIEAWKRHTGLPGAGR